jgi:hypothetical protein
MSFTLSTVPLLLLSLLLCFRAKGQLLPVVMFMSIFQAASIVNLGGAGAEMGIGPSFLLVLVVVIKKLCSPTEIGVSLNQPLKSTGILLILFTAYATLSVFLNPVIFQGVPFTNPKFGFQVPLQPNTNFLTQLVYLLVSVGLYFVAAYKTTPAELAKSIDWYVGGAVLAAGIAMYQFIGMKTGLPFPSDYLHTSPTFQMFEGYEINGFPRMNGSFTEAAAAAFCFTSALSLAVWKLLTGFTSLRNVLSALILFIGLMLTISTTGYICLGYILLVAGVVYLIHWTGSSTARSNKLLLAIPAFIVLLVIAVNPRFQESFMSLIHTVVLDKTKTFSYEERTQMNDDALATASQTHWLGAGWGVCRASSLFPTMLGNVGLPGGILFVLMIGQVLLPILKRRGIKLPIHGAVLFSLGTVLLNLGISMPEIGAPVIWMFLAVASRLAGEDGATFLRLPRIQPVNNSLVVAA